MNILIRMPYASAKDAGADGKSVLTKAVRAAYAKSKAAQEASREKKNGSECSKEVPK